jgi:hypothetical protein
LAKEAGIEDPTENLLDASPEVATQLYERYGVHPYYFTSIIEDPTPERAAEIRRALEVYLDVPRPKEK